MTLFSKAGGRLFRIVLIFSLISVLTIALMSFFTYRAMADMKEIALSEGIDLETQSFYTQLIDNMRLGTVLGSLSAVMIAVAARYGLRETSRNISEGMRSRQGGPNETVAENIVDSGSTPSAGNGN